MPELPEVETVCRGIARHLIKHRIESVIVRCRQLRQPVSAALLRPCVGQIINRVCRRGKYIIIHTHHGDIIIHLGMSGVLYFSSLPPKDKHEHIGFNINAQYLIYKDPRRFGLVIWSDNAAAHPLLKNLGPEPLSAAFNADILYHRLRHRRIPIKQALLDGGIVAGIGNIYACEALYAAKIHPLSLSCRIRPHRLLKLTNAIQTILKKAIAAGGSTIRDFAQPNHQSGFFQFEWQVYECAGRQCACGGAIRRIKQSGRSTYYCPRCQH